MAINIFKTACTQSLLHPIDDILSNFLALRLKEKVMQEAIIELYILELGRCLFEQILRGQRIGHFISSSVKDKEWDGHGLQVAQQVR